MVNTNSSNVSPTCSSVVITAELAVLSGQFTVQGGGSVLPGVLTSPAITGANRHTVSIRELSVRIFIGASKLRLAKG